MRLITRSRLSLKSLIVVFQRIRLSKLLEFSDRLSMNYGILFLNRIIVAAFYYE